MGDGGPGRHEGKREGGGGVNDIPKGGEKQNKVGTCDFLHLSTKKKKEGRKI